MNEQKLVVTTSQGKVHEIFGSKKQIDVIERNILVDIENVTITNLFSFRNGDVDSLERVDLV